MYWIVLIILFAIIQLEIMYLFMRVEEEGKWILKLTKRIEEVIYDEVKETKEINEILNEMLNIDNPYQE